ncbi:uncharacterized protein LOC120645065 [Panicum virgatum]|uniref:PGG domain-containing protein n=1 Tax=Panicum virgatum TaxID=38727 RepID=A0A8T0PT41_PANVG|nr:uncharacterized protein LOC120645065 [Panicum virgatum]KAG2563669.1 hypothetical protein PVAP13_8KG059600 [Panicum virgatum]
MADSGGVRGGVGGGGGGGVDSWEYKLRKYLLLLATLVATVTYGAAFNPPGGVWQGADPAIERLTGDPIIRETSYRRYLAFFYSNATAFASSLVVIVLVLILSVLHEAHEQAAGTDRPRNLAPLRILRVVMVLDLLSLMGAYAAGTFRDRLTATYSSVLLAGVVIYLLVHTVLASCPPDEEEKDGNGSSAAKKEEAEKKMAKLRKVLMLLATFAVSVTYVSGLSAPGGFWADDAGGHKPGVAILRGGPHDARLKAFFVLNTTAFVASLLIIIILLDKKLSISPNLRSFELYGFITVAIVGLVGAYSAGSCRHVDTTVYVNSLVGAVIVFILAQAAIVKFCKETIKESCLWKLLEGIPGKVSGCLSGNGDASVEKQQRQVLERARSLVLLLATLAAAITYQAGLNPPGGLWQGDDAGGRYKAGDPVLLTTNPRRYKAFYYCNSTAFVASLLAIVLVRMKTLHHHNALEAAMILDLLGLIGAYAAGSCRDVTTSIYAMALAGAVLVYVVIHVVLFTLDHNEAAAPVVSGKEKEDPVEKRRKRLLLFAILAATITYQAGLTPPSGFLAGDDPATGRRAGDPVLLNNYPRRYTAFFYCNSVSFMLSIALIILLVNPNLYRPAIRSNALSVCTAAGMSGIMGAYAAGCTQHLKTSIYIFALAGFVLFVVIVAVVFWVFRDDDKGKPADGSSSSSSQGRAEKSSTNEDLEKGKNDDAGKKAEEDEKEKRRHAKRKYLMLLGILVASVTYQAGLAPPGGSWQSDGGGHAAGDPVMHDNRRHRYLAFYYSNSTSFVASIVVIVLLLPQSLHKDDKWAAWWLGVMNTTIVLDLLGLLIAYAAGSSRSWKTAGYVSALVIAVLAYFVVHVAVSRFVRRGRGKQRDSSGDGVDSTQHHQQQQQQQQKNGQAVQPAQTN